MPSIEDWINHPSGVVQNLFDRSGSFEISQVRDYFGDKLKTKNALSWIPSLNDSPLHNLRPNSLVRYRCMVQDMYDPEFYLGVYEVVDTKSGETCMKSGKYKDVAECGPQQSINLESKKNVTMDRMTLYCVPVPGEAEWVKKNAEIGKTKISPFPSTSKTTPRAKRGLDDDPTASSETDEPMEGADKLNANGSAIDAVTMEAQDSKRLQTDRQESSTSAGPDLNYPLPGEMGPACLVKVYDDINTFKVNEMVEFIGILSVDPSLAHFQQKGPSEEGETIMSPVEETKEELEAHAPPPSLVPRLHTVLHHSLGHVNPLVPDTTSDEHKIVCEALESEVDTIRGQLMSVLEHAVLGDRLAAEYFLCYLVSSVYARADVMPLGKFCLNLSNTPKTPVYSDLLHHLVSNLTTQSYILHMSLANMNQMRFSPHKDYTANRLRSGILQLADQTAFVVDETSLEPGQLDVHGVRNIQALGNLISWQKVEYDFDFHKQDFRSNVSVLLLSEGKSILPSDCLLPIQRETTPDNLRDHFTQLDPRLSDDLLTKCRTFLGMAKTITYNLTDEMQMVMQDDFVTMRKDDPKNMTVDDFHSLLNLTRLLSLTHFKPGPTVELWHKAKVMEADRKLRIQQVAARSQAVSQSA